MSEFLYNQNSTMKILGNQCGIMSEEEFNKVQDIVSAYRNTQNDSLVILMMHLFGKGFLFDFLKNVYQLGKMNGIRCERERRKVLNNHGG